MIILIVINETDLCNITNSNSNSNSNNDNKSNNIHKPNGTNIHYTYYYLFQRGTGRRMAGSDRRCFEHLYNNIMNIQM